MNKLIFCIILIFLVNSTLPLTTGCMEKKESTSIMAEPSVTEEKKESTPIVPEPSVPEEKSGMMLIEGGTFKMGSNNGESNEKPVHEVSVDSFYMGKYEVTNKEYCEFLNSEGNQKECICKWIILSINDNRAFEDEYCGIIVGVSSDSFEVKAGYEAHPAVYVTWYGAVAYCNWLSEEEGLDKCYGVKGDRRNVDISKNGYRLPTEAEWEYACLAGADTEYPWGDEMDEDYCWYANNSAVNHEEVGQKKPNSYGLYDMNGNVWEWCSDWYNSDYYGNSPSCNPTGPETGSCRVWRGGCFACYPVYCRSAYRGSTGMAPFRGLGFRLCRSAP